MLKVTLAGEGGDNNNVIDWGKVEWLIIIIIIIINFI